jgi:uncharacterized membrane protein YeaQ/YmgE (transglycosylase-associated protein family)
MKDFFDDKDLVIVSVLLIGLYAMYCYPGTQSQSIVMSIISGLFGVAVGRKL